MRFTPSTSTLFLRPALLVALAAFARPCAAAGEVAADPVAIRPGEPVTLRLYATGDKVTVSGGRFGKGTDVTGRKEVIDRPKTTTTYVFDVHRAPEKDPDPLITPQTHFRYSVTVQARPELPTFIAYSDPRGWRVTYPTGWKRDAETTPDVGPGGLMFFQKEDDSVERMAIAVLRPSLGMTNCAELMKKVQADIPAHYDEMTIHSDEETLFEGEPARLIVFSGMDQTHPGTRAKSIVLTFVQGEYAYVVSARTKATVFETRRAILERMARSFHFLRKSSLPKTKELSSAR